MDVTLWDGMLLVLLVMALFGMVLLSLRQMYGSSNMSTIDDTATDLQSISDLIDQLPDAIQAAIAAGTISVTLDWEEVTRDEDDYPTIKPRFKITSTGGSSRDAATYSVG
jgi:hypothetical protein